MATDRTKPGLKGLKLLGRSETHYPTKPAADILETFPNRYPQRDYWIRFDCAEFTSVCPVTGQPDFARIRIEYIPGERCIETKSLKFYLVLVSQHALVSTRRFLTASWKTSSRPARRAGRIVHGEFAARGRHQRDGRRGVPGVTALRGAGTSANGVNGHA